MRAAADDDTAAAEVVAMARAKQVVAPVVSERPAWFRAGSHFFGWGNIAVIRNQSIPEQRATLYHEWVHRVLSPLFGSMRRLRAQLRASGYWRSALLRYLEEAMAERYGQLRAYGLGDMLTGFAFPITGGYVTVSQLVTEGVAIENIVVGGAIFHVV